MPQTTEQALSALRDLGSVEELESLARAGLAPPVRPKANTHIHLPPNFSAFESVEQAVSLAAEEGIGVLGVSNYYHYGVYGDFVREVRKRGIFPLFGTELIALIDDLRRGGVRVNDPANPGKMYICGKGITRFAKPTADARAILDVVRRNDAARMKEMTRRLADLLAGTGLETHLDDRAVIDMVVRRHRCPAETVTLQERHVAQAFQEAVFAVTAPADRPERLAAVFGERPAAACDDAAGVQKEIRSRLMKAGKPAFVAETFIDLDRARRLILELGGIPCYPTLADGADPICEYETPVSKLIESLRAARIHCVEFIPTRNRPDVLVEYVTAMREARLVVTAGTEHNTLDMLPIEPACAGGAPVGEDVENIFWEGACVVAAHEFLALHGRCGYVDARGELDPSFGDSQERIEAMRRLGAAVIQRYYETTPR
jgi:predicted metal-dependent phosphoesterase TrpH